MGGSNQRSENTAPQKISSPDVNLDGSVKGDGGEGPDGEETGRESTIRPSPISLQTIRIRIVGWGKTLLRLGAIAVFLLGVYAIYHSQTASVVPQLSILGYDVPEVWDFNEIEVLLYSGIIAMMVGLGMAYRWIITDNQTGLV